MVIVRLTCETPKRKSQREISSLALLTLTQKHTQEHRRLWPTHKHTETKVKSLKSNTLQE